MKKLPLLALLLSFTLTGRATLMQVTGTFNGAPTNGAATHLLSGNFTANFDDTLVAANGNTTLDNLSLTSLFLSNPVIGSRTFDLSNTYLDLGFVNGGLRSFTLGDIVNNVVSPGTDDFSMYFESGPGLILSQMVVAKQAGGFYGVDFRFNDATTGSFAVSVASPVDVPDSAATAWLMALGCFGLVPFRRLAGARS